MMASGAKRLFPAGHVVESMCDDLNDMIRREFRPHIYGSVESIRRIPMFRQGLAETPDREFRQGERVLTDGARFRA